MPARRPPRLPWCVRRGGSGPRGARTRHYGSCRYAETPDSSSRRRPLSRRHVAGAAGTTTDGVDLRQDPPAMIGVSSWSCSEVRKHRGIVGLIAMIVQAQASHRPHASASRSLCSFIRRSYGSNSSRAACRVVRTPALPIGCDPLRTDGLAVLGELEHSRQRRPTDDLGQTVCYGRIQKTGHHLRRAEEQRMPRRWESRIL